MNTESEFWRGMVDRPKRRVVMIAIQGYALHGFGRIVFDDFVSPIVNVVLFAITCLIVWSLIDDVRWIWRIFDLIDRKPS